MRETIVDLHMHTFYSDGWLAPEEVVGHAQSLRLEAIAITDHDNMRGWRAARPFAAEAGLELIPGVELTTHWELNGQSASVDLLAYFVDGDDEAFRKLLANTLVDMTRRIEVCCDELTQMGYALTLDDVHAVNPRFAGAAPLILALMRRGHVRSFGAGLDLFRRAWENVPPPQLTIETAIDSVHAAGGVTVLAHPTRIPYQEGMLDGEHLGRLKKAGLDAVEVFHHSLDEEAREHYLELAAAVGLLISGGSDEHGFDDVVRRMGQQPVTVEMLDALRERANEYR